MSTAQGTSSRPLLRRLWLVLGAVSLASFAALLYYGGEIYQAAPPIPRSVNTTDGEVVFLEKDILEGQDVWRSIGGQELGSVWGHGAYTAPDWTADWLHRESVWILDEWARSEGAAAFDELDAERQAALQARLQGELRANTYDPGTGIISISPLRRRAITHVQRHYLGLFGDDASLAGLRESYAMPPDTVSTEARREALTAFFFWATWACVTERPGSTITYSHNWPPERLVGNRPTGAILVVSVASFILLLSGIGALVWLYAARRETWQGTQLQTPTDPLLGLRPTPSMRATMKYFWVVGAMVVLQMAFGVVVAHYGVEGTGLYGIPLAEWIPYSLARTWHVQLGIFWIATSWLATGLCIGPGIAGAEPRFQRLGVNVLFVALVLVVGGSMAGQAAAIHQQLGDAANFWVGHQGYEYVDLGRLWQILLFVGLLLWLGLMLNALLGTFRRAEGPDKQLLGVFLLSAAAIAFFYGAGLMWGRHTNLAIAEYWRWWVVHLWVEGFFEVFAVAIIAFAFTRMQLIRVSTATLAVLFTTLLYLMGGILGMFHHLYFTGTPTAVLVLGGLFSALELVPLVLVGYEAYENWSLVRATPWVQHHKWPIYFFVAVSFWNLVGAGLFGFLINPPIALYFMQGLNTTAVHAHAALFGVYGMLGLGLMLLSLRTLTARAEWRTGVLSFAFWSMNVGLALQILMSLLPIGLLQTWASVEHGMWYARSAEFLQTPLLENLRWARAVGDTIFAAGMLAMGWFVVGLSTGWSIRGEREDARTVAPGAAEAG